MTNETRCRPSHVMLYVSPVGSSRWQVSVDNEDYEPVRKAHSDELLGWTGFCKVEDHAGLCSLPLAVAIVSIGAGSSPYPLHSLYCPALSSPR